MVLIIIVCAIAWGVCRFKKVDFLDTLFLGADWKTTKYIIYEKGE